MTTATTRRTNAADMSVGEERADGTFYLGYHKDPKDGQLKDWFIMSKDLRDLSGERLSLNFNQAAEVVKKLQSGKYLESDKHNDWHRHSDWQLAPDNVAHAEISERERTGETRTGGHGVAGHGGVMAHRDINGRKEIRTDLPSIGNDGSFRNSLSMDNAIQSRLEGQSGYDSTTEGWQEQERSIAVKQFDARNTGAFAGTYDHNLSFPRSRYLTGSVRPADPEKGLLKKVIARSFVDGEQELIDEGFVGFARLVRAELRQG